MEPQPESCLFNIIKGDFLYKIANETEWTRLESTHGNSKYSCWDIVFDSGVVLTQKNYRHGSKCKLKLILKSPVINEHAQATIEASCVEVGSPSLTAFGDHNHKDEAKAIERAKTLPLALLNRKITAVKLRNLLVLKPRAKGSDRQELCNPNTPKHPTRKELHKVRALIEHDYRAMCAAQTNIGSEPGQTKELGIQTRPSSSSTAVFAHRSPTLEERLQRHEESAAQGEIWLREDWEGSKHAMLRAVTAAFHDEWDKRLETAVARFRSQTTWVREMIERQEKVWKEDPRIVKTYGASNMID